ncbi:hypothetical protein PRZ48_012610 [Zasmidium cellare]|uniref:F-box domain-containing protein n=1 Tax=Zasmidium cellare TaxID=395010 RepID=A0ABR0E5W8_ZASCE|nr:hypothetical protein PRZ48_012610 [Zasmidium cellare]
MTTYQFLAKLHYKHLRMIRNFYLDVDDRHFEMKLKASEKGPKPAVYRKGVSLRAHDHIAKRIERYLLRIANEHANGKNITKNTMFSLPDNLKKAWYKTSSFLHADADPTNSVVTKVMLVITPYRQRSGDRYWRLNDYITATIPELRERARQAGYPTPKNIDNQDLIEIIHRIDRQLPNYNTCKITRLRKFAKDRGLVRRPNLFDEEYLINALTAADVEIKPFPLLDLPPELRLHVYEWYMAGFPRELQSPIQPPLTRVCRLIRKESTPIFYQACHFRINMSPSLRGNKRRLRFDNDDHHFLMALLPSRLAFIQNFKLCFRIWPHPRPECMVRVDVELDQGSQPRLIAKSDLKHSPSRAKVDELCKKIEVALFEYFSTRKGEEVGGEGEGKSAGLKLKLEDVYTARNLVEEIFCPI